MSPRFKARLLALILFSVVIGGLVLRSSWHEHLMGRDAFLAYQARRFDLHLATMRQPLGHLVSYTIMMALVMGVYESLATISEKLFAVNTNHQPSE